MKTLLIFGTIEKCTFENSYFYDFTLYGQTDAAPQISHITSQRLKLNGYNDLDTYARQKFAEYYKTDLFNIIADEKLIYIK